jgi:hypothetical protein
LFVHACQRGIKLIIHNSHLSTPSPYLDLSNFAVSYAVSIRIRGQHLFFATNIESCYFRPCRSSPSLFHHHTPQAATLCADSDLSVLLGLARQGEALAVSPLRLASASRGELSSPLQGRTSCGPWSPGWDPLSSRPGRAATAVGRGCCLCQSVPGVQQVGPPVQVPSPTSVREALQRMGCATRFRWAPPDCAERSGPKWGKGTRPTLLLFAPRSNPPVIRQLAAARPRRGEPCVVCRGSSLLPALALCCRWLWGGCLTAGRDEPGRAGLPPVPFWRSGVGPPGLLDSFVRNTASHARQPSRPRSPIHPHIITFLSSLPGREGRPYFVC